MAYEVNCFSDRRCDLGEGPLWHAGRGALIWVDINRRHLIERPLAGADGGERAWNLAYQATAVLGDAQDSGKVWLVTAQGLVHFDLETGGETMHLPWGMGADMRTNDAGVGSDGRLWFGSMQCRPAEARGALYSVGSEGGERVEFRGIGIPNTFVAGRDDAMLISDSMSGEIFSFGPGKDPHASWLALAPDTPDGGALDQRGCLWIAMWDGHAVRCYAPGGELIDQVDLPVPRPTSCCFGGEHGDELFITSASEGLTGQELDRYPLSGGVFRVRMAVGGAPVRPFQRG